MRTGELVDLNFYIDKLSNLLDEEEGSITSSSAPGEQNLDGVQPESPDLIFKPLNSTDGNSSGQDGNMCSVDAKGNGQFGEHKVFDRQISADNVENHISDKPHDSISHKTNNHESLHGELPKLTADDVDKYFAGLSLTKKRVPRNSENVFFPSTFVPPACDMFSSGPLALSDVAMRNPARMEMDEDGQSDSGSDSGSASAAGSDSDSDYDSDSTPPEIENLSPEIVEIPLSPEIMEIPLSPEIMEIPLSPEIVEIQHSPEIVEIPKTLNDHLPDYTMEELRMIYQGQMEKECCPCRDIFFKGEYSVVEMINKNYSERLIAKVKRENNIPDHVYLPDPFKRPVGSRTLKEFQEYKEVLYKWFDERDKAREYKRQKKEREQQGLPDQEQAHYQHYDQNHQNWRQPGDDGQQLYQQKSLQLHEPPYQASLNILSRLLGGQRKPVNYNWEEFQMCVAVESVIALGPLTPEEALGCTEGTNTDEFKQAYKEHWDRITQEMIYDPCEPEITVDDVLAFPELEPALHDRFRKRLAAARAGETEELEESPQKKQDLSMKQNKDQTPVTMQTPIASSLKIQQFNHQEGYNTYNRVAGDPMPDNILENEDDNMEKEELAFPELEPALHGDSRKRLAEVGAVEFEPLSKKMATDTNPSVPTVTESHQSTTTIRVIDGPSMELDGFTCSNPNEVRNNTYSRVSHSRSASLSTNKSIGSRGTSVGENNDPSPRSSSRPRYYTTSEDEQSDSDDKKSEDDSWDWSEDEVFEPAEDVVAETGSEKSGNSTPNEGVLDEREFFSD